MKFELPPSPVPGTSHWFYARNRYGRAGSRISTMRWESKEEADAWIATNNKVYPNDLYWVEEEVITIHPPLEPGKKEGTFKVHVSEYIENEDNRELGEMYVAETEFAGFFEGWMAALHPKVKIEFNIGEYRVVPDPNPLWLREEIQKALKVLHTSRSAVTLVVEDVPQDP